MSKIKFGDVLYIKGRIGRQALKKDEYLENGDYYLVTGIDITDEHRIDFNNCYYVSRERYEMDEAIQLKEGDIIVTKDGTIGKIGIIENLDKPATLNSHLFLIRNKAPEILNTGFLFYVLNSKHFQKFATNNTTGSNIPAFTQKNISEYEIDLPDLETQEKMESILSNIDKKIRLNNKINSELEAIAKELYEYRFVQFDFPDENGKPYKSSGGKMVWNDELKREIPEGWESFLLRDLFDYLEGPGITKDKYSTNPTDLNFINIRCIENGFVNTDNCNKIKKDKIEGYDKFMLQVNDIIISTSGTLGTIGIITKDNLPLLLNTSIIRFRSIEKQYFCYMWQYLKSDLFVKLLNQASTGSIQKNVGPTHLNEMHILKPPKELIEKFETIIFPTFSKIVNMNNENRKLSELRDFLLPMLMNGQVTVK